MASRRASDLCAAPQPLKRVTAPPAFRDAPFHEGRPPVPLLPARPPTRGAPDGSELSARANLPASLVRRARPIPSVKVGLLTDGPLHLPDKVAKVTAARRPLAPAREPQA